MELTEKQHDAMTELINIGYGRAAGALSELTGHRITLGLPEVAIHEIHQIASILAKLITGEVASVNQIFSGPVAGNALLLLDEEAALTLNRLLTGNEDIQKLDTAAREVITEVGNIVLNACLGSFGNLLKVEVCFSVPRLTVEGVEDVMSSITVDNEELSGALMVHTRFHLRDSAIKGYLMVILGVVSLERMLIELDRWEERQLRA